MLAQSIAVRPASAVDVLLSWSRIAGAASYNVYVRYDTKAFVKTTGPDGSGISSTLVAEALGPSSARNAWQAVEGVGTSLSSGAVNYLVPALPVGPRIFFTVTTKVSGNTTESRHSNELSVDYAAVAGVVDSDGDGLTDAEEDANLNRKRDANETDRAKADTDLDGLSDGAEVAAGLDPLNGDSDGDGKVDSQDTCYDLDRDGFGAAGIAWSTCPVDNCPDVGNAYQIDSDADGMGEACDPCTNVGDKQTISIKPKLVLRGINTERVPDNDGLTIKGDFNLPSTAGFSALNPMGKGGRIVLTDRNGDPILDIALPAGAFGTKGVRRGWKTNPTLSVWKYRDRTNQRVGGIAKFVAKNVGGSSARQVKIAIRGAGGDYPVYTADSPVNVAVTLGDNAASRSGQCGETSFRSRDCLFTIGGQILNCQRE
jgi:hypothetical protein